MKVLVIGSGGREHALCWKLRQSPALTELFCAPGNPGIAALADCVNIAPDEIQKLADFATDMKIDLTVIGPELPLTLGLADELERRGLAAWGPSREAAQIEGSKVFAKKFMRRHGIPTGDFAVVHDAAEAREAQQRFGFPVVLKADGLAAGKGVLIPENEEEFDRALDDLFEARRFGTSADRVLVEEFLEGEEVSFIALSDGERLLPMATSKDYKRIGEGDTGPNTGGMGCHSPAGVLPSGAAAEILEKILRPTVAGMAAEGRRFIGFLYAGLILTEDGPKVLEYNARLGDPEAQPLLMRLDEDLLPVLSSGAAGQFEPRRLAFKKEAAACVVLASRGYPGTPARGEVIEGLAAAEELAGVEVFHAGTGRTDQGVVATGGRVLNVCARGSDLLDALRHTYAATQEIHWPSKVLRRDIGRRILDAQSSSAGA
ncbi:MAG: phosphoribosylamine--glycine ligase [Acidobacteriota bacterium]